MVSRSAYSLPLAMAMWQTAGRYTSMDRQMRVSGRLARRWLRSGRLYRGADDLLFAVDPADAFQAAMLLGLFNRQSNAIMRAYVPPGATAIDVGAHLGYFALRLARLVGPQGAVHAFEPDPRLSSRLREHAAVNGVSWLTANDRGLFDRPLEGQTFLLPPILGWASVATAPAEAETNSTSIDLTTLDLYVRERQIDPASIRFIKVDVEGSELAVLRGAEETLAAAPAAVLVEVVPDRSVAQGDDPDAIPALMAGLGFEAFAPVAVHGGRFRLVPGTGRELGQDVLFVKRGQFVDPGARGRR